MEYQTFMVKKKNRKTGSWENTVMVGATFIRHSRTLEQNKHLAISICDFNQICSLYPNFSNLASPKPPYNNYDTSKDASTRQPRLDFEGNEGVAPPFDFPASPSGARSNQVKATFDTS